MSVLLTKKIKKRLTTIIKTRNSKVFVHLLEEKKKTEDVFKIN